MKARQLANDPAKASSRMAENLFWQTLCMRMCEETGATGLTFQKLIKDHNATCFIFNSFVFPPHLRHPALDLLSGRRTIVHLIPMLNEQPLKQLGMAGFRLRLFRAEEITVWLPTSWWIEENKLTKQKEHLLFAYHHCHERLSLILTNLVMTIHFKAKTLLLAHLRMYLLMRSAVHCFLLQYQLPVCVEFFNTNFYQVTPLPSNLPAAGLDPENALSSLRFGKH